MLKLISFINRFALRLSGVVIKKDVFLHPFICFRKGFANGKKGSIEIGSSCEISRGTVLKAYGGRIDIGENTFLGEYVVIYGHGSVSIGQNTLIAMHTCIISSNHTIPGKNSLIRSKPDVLLPVSIGDDVWIGAGVKILGGVTVGNGCVIGAGAVVTKDIPPFAIATGVPARISKYRDG